MDYKKQEELNKIISESNKKIIIKKLKDYYDIVYSYRKNSQEIATLAYWKAKKDGRLDSLNRILKIEITSQDRTL